MAVYIVVAIVAGVLLGFGFRRAARALFAFRGMRALKCPENLQPVAVELASWPVVVAAAAFGNPVPRVRNCSRWPERRTCDQACVREVRTAPANSLVRNIVANWCRYNVCVCCGAPLAKLHVGAHRPHLIDRELRILEWRDVPPQDLPQTLRSCEPVCETCVASETRIW